MKTQIIVTTLTALLSTNLLAAGSHSGGHGHHDSMDAHWASPADEANKPNPIKSSSNSISKGYAIYQKNCASCHGKEAMGDGPAGTYLNPKPTNLKVMSGNHTDGDFAWKIANGRGPMPAWKGILSESDIWNTVNYIQSLKTTSNHEKNDGHGKGHGSHDH